jgi:hypothetical protein
MAFVLGIRYTFSEKRVSNGLFQFIRITPVSFAENPGEEQDDGMLRTEKAADEKSGDSRSPGKYFS